MECLIFDALWLVISYIHHSLDVHLFVASRCFFLHFLRLARVSAFFLLILVHLLFLFLGRSWGRFAHNLFDLFVDLFDLFFHLLDGNHWIFVLGFVLLLFIRVEDPALDPVDMTVAFLSLFGRDVFVLFVLNSWRNTNELSRSMLLFSASSSFLSSLTNCSRLSYRLRIGLILVLTALIL